ncbi:MAG: hypothetical protein LUG15_05095, partial [Oscillospiraceae bacterium]|nr:hypothetical protein [Oscillospiraceae bacterium]
MRYQLRQSSVFHTNKSNYNKSPRDCQAVFSHFRATAFIFKAATQESAGSDLLSQRGGYPQGAYTHRALIATIKKDDALDIGC